MENIEEMKDTRGKLATAQQRKASNPLKSVWVEASAGTGKTKVLSDRVLRLLLNGVKPARILCLTYTKAAAVEMSSRIAGRLSKWAVADVAELKKELLSLLGELPTERCDYEKLEARARQLFALLLDTPGGMKIQTIHSFCQDVLKRFPLEAQISPYFEVMDDRSAAEAIEEIKTRLLKKVEQEPESPAAQALGFLTRNVSERDFPKVMNTIAANRNKIIRMMQRYPALETVLAKIADNLGIASTDTPESLNNEFWQGFDAERIRRIMAALSLGAKTDKARAEDLAYVLSSNDKPAGYDLYKGVFLKSNGEAKTATKAAIAAYTEIVDDIAVEAARIQKLEKKLAALRLFASTKAVLLLAEELIGGYNNYKNQYSKMDYEDLIVLTRHLLENQAVAQWVLYKLDGGIDSVLIDEAQDTSPDQWAIIKSVTEEFFAGQGVDDIVRTVFVVGDRKQSIYSFQGADPEKFEEMRRYFKAVDEDFEEVHLDVSFRSTAAVLDVVNTVFSDEASKKGVVLPEQDITHIPFRIGDGGRVEIWPVIEPEEGENPDVYRPPVERVSGETTSSRLAKEIARRIKKMVDGGEILVSQGRPLHYRDFMVLVQRRNSFVEELVRACKSAGVAIAGVDKIKLLEQIAVQDFISLGKFLLLPTDDLSLAEVLKSPVWGLDDDDLFRLCYNRGGASLWTRLGDDARYASVYADLQVLMNMVDYVRPFELYSFVLNKLKGRQKYVERMGEEVEDGIDEFINLTVDFEQGHIPSLQGFIDWVSKDEAEIKREQEQGGADAVRIMTVHGSKGLQAPVVILPDTVRMPQNKREAGLLWNDVLYYPLCADDYGEVGDEINNREKEKREDEYRRLLYVALTRAEDRLYVCGYKGKNAVKDESWYEICRRNFSKIGDELEDGMICYQTSQEAAPKEAKESSLQSHDLPDFSWINLPAAEEDILAKPYTPSKPDEEEPSVVSPIFKEDVNRYRRGNVIHKLLQFLPDVRTANKEQVIREFLAVQAPEFGFEETERVVREVLLLVEDVRFRKIFGPESRAEVPIMGLADGKIISGQLDRLVVDEEEVLIVDFKTNRPAAETAADIPEVYLKQLRAYKRLAAGIYPGKDIHTYILWTDTANLMLVS